MGYLSSSRVQGFGSNLLHAQADSLRLGIDVEHDCLDRFAGVEQLRGVLHPLRPAHLGDVDQALDALLELDEGAVVGEAHHLALDAGPDRVLLVGPVPRVLLDLLQAQADALAGGVELEDHHPDVLAHLEHLARVPDAAPAHVGHVEQAIDAAEVDEGAVIGEVLHDPLQDGALLQVLERLLLQLLALLLEEDAAGQDDVAPLLVELDDLELELLPDELVEVADRADVNLRAREERLHPDVDGEAALDAADDDALDEFVPLAGGRDLVPDAHLVGLLLGEDDHAGVVLARLDEHVHAVPDLHERLAARDGDKLVEGHLALGLVADVHDHVVLRDLDHGAADDAALLDLSGAGLALGEQLGEVLCLLLGRTDSLILHSIETRFLWAGAGGRG